MRFGFLPRRRAVPLYVCVIRKAGTHLVKPVLEAMGLECRSVLDADAVRGTLRPIPPTDCREGIRKRSFALANVPPPRTLQGECEAGRAKIILGIRDPRAVFLSTLDFLDWRVPMPSPEWHAVGFYRSALRQAYATRDDLARALLDGRILPDNPYDIGMQFARNRLLYHHPKVLTLRYEALVEAGVRMDDAPIRQIAEYLDIGLDRLPANILKASLASPSATKHRAIADRWKEELTPAIREAFVKRHGGLVEEFGYAPD